MFVRNCVTYCLVVLLFSFAASKHYLIISNSVKDCRYKRFKIDQKIYNFIFAKLGPTWGYMAVIFFVWWLPTPHSIVANSENLHTSKKWNRNSIETSSTNVMNVITRPLEKVILKLIKILSIKASSINAMNVITRPLRKVILILIKTLSINTAI